MPFEKQFTFLRIFHLEKQHWFAILSGSCVITNFFNFLILGNSYRPKRFPPASSSRFVFDKMVFCCFMFVSDHTWCTEFETINYLNMTRLQHHPIALETKKILSVAFGRQGAYLNVGFGLQMVCRCSHILFLGQQVQGLILFITNTYIISRTLSL